MQKFMFGVLLILSAGGVGLALVTAWMEYRLSKLAPSWRGVTASTRRHRILLKLSLVLTNTVLIVRLIQAGALATDVSWAAWGYGFGLLGMTGALGLIARDTIEDTAIEENEQRKLANHVRLDSLETRLTVEEKRNTDIELFASEQAERQAVSEQRADDTEEHA